MLPLLLVLLLCGCNPSVDSIYATGSASLENVSEYSGDPYKEVDGNIPQFDEDEYTTEAFEIYSELDALGRCGVAYANICQELVELGIDFIRIGNPYSCEADYQPYLLSELASHCTTLNELKDKVEKTRVVVGTTTAFSAGTNLFKIKQFSLAIIDEASQILEPHILPLLCATDKQGQCAIKKLEISTTHIQQARDLFIFQCYTGLAYADLSSFDYSNCVEKDGKMFYHAKRTKTDTDFVFQLLTPAVELLKKYDFCLPRISNQKYNDYLKVIGEIVGVPNLHSHMGRATAATPCRIT